MTKLSARPVGAGNSIEAAAFVLGFSRPFTAVEIQAMQSLQQVFLKEFPHFQALNSVTVDVKEAGAGAGITLAVNGVLLQKQSAKGAVLWSLQIADNTIVVSCMEYSRWEAVWDIAKDYLLRAANHLAAPDNAVNMVSLQVVDKFLYDSAVNEYELDDVFNVESPYLTRQVKKAGPLWHVNQGWFEIVDLSDQSVRNLNVVNITSANVGPSLQSSVDHLGQFFLGSGGIPHSADGKLTPGGVDVIAKVFAILHVKNKTVLREVLSSNKIKEIGL